MCLVHVYGAGLEVDTYGGRRQRKNRLEVMDIAGLCSTWYSALSLNVLHADDSVVWLQNTRDEIHTVQYGYISTHC